MRLLESISDKCSHNGLKAKGEQFEATDSHARALIGLGWAKYATRVMVAAQVPEPEPTKSSPVRATKRAYRRRDMQAQA